MDDYPGNSHREKEERVPPKKAAEVKHIERVTKGEVTRRRKPLGTRFKETFIGGDGKTVWQYVVMDILIPAAKDMIVDAGQQGIERTIFGGETRSRRGGSRSSGNNGYVSYNRMSDRGPAGWGSNREPRREISKRARTAHEFDEIVLESRGEAEEVLDRMYDLISKFEVAAVSDLYELTGIHGNYTDNKWGWLDLRGASVSRVRGGYSLNLPQPEPLE